MPIRRLPPIFAKVRFRLRPADVPPVVFRFSKQHINDARETIQRMWDEVPLYTYSHCWMETPYLGIMAYCPDEECVHVRAWNKNGKHATKFQFRSFDEGGLSDMEKVVKAQYFQAAYALHLYTERAAEVSVNTLSRNSPSAHRREGDTLRYAQLDDLASAAGQSRQRGYARPCEVSGIKMREHDVRGHWRTYPSGVRVWVKPHKRGDVGLGRVQRVMQ
ncbi:hypothetical protein [Sediminimonas sp.]|uniref:hypothetical protein n=1 Tax=Sediminimonas sp. TaxID=2823379 RepID=UPI0025F90F92|nr:hypothetical protein [Sediminimonas sp.]